METVMAAQHLIMNKFHADEAINTREARKEVLLRT